MTSMWLAASKKPSHSRHRASTAPNLPSCTNSFRVICPTSRYIFCTEWQVEIEIQNTLKRYSKWYSRWMYMIMNILDQHEWNMFLFWRMARAKKKVFGFLESGMRGIQEVEEEPWIKSALGAPGGFKVNLVNLFAALHLHLLQQKKISECLISAHPAGIDKVLRPFNATGKHCNREPLLPCHCEHWMLDAWVLSRDAATWSTVLQASRGR